MVYGLVYGCYHLHVPRRPLGMPFMSLTQYWDLSLVNQQHQPV